MIDQATLNEIFFISVHSLNELAFVLAKMRLNREEIENYLNVFSQTAPAAITGAHFQRAIQLAYKVSFHHTSDCLHTAIAEANCTELLTYNKSDFQLIQHHTKLKITIL